jgi:hypothetical protein
VNDPCPKLLAQAEVNALHPGTEVMVLAPRLHSQPRRCVIRKRRTGRGHHGHYATDAHTSFNSEGDPLGAEFFYTTLDVVGKGPRDTRVWMATGSEPQKGSPA